ncbi:N-acetyl-alpha-D-glucosaminyl L-malate synthase BshA [Candidatus Bipolaricaulota bacterium]|nr:N-acetyl-alpha-D-glucosaminyl L-malate synthase BshA [Candidatus Bipolaricaulota bacterium]
MKIGICCYPSHGGSGVVATELGKHLAERGHEVAFVSYDTPLRLSELPPRVSFHEVEIEQYPLLKHFPYTLALASKLAEVAETHELDILHAHYAIPFGAAALLAKQIVRSRDVKVALTLHGTDITLVGNNASFKPVTKMTIENADAVTVVSQFLKDETIRQFDVQRELRVIYNFIDPERHELEPCPCIPQCSMNSQKTIMHISNFRPVKRIRDVIAVFAKICASVDSRLILVGDGPDAIVAREMGQELGILDRIKFIGIVDRVAPLLARADLFLLPSSTESFGLVALEAMASGVPVIASDVGGIPEVVEHGRTGFLAPVGDVDAMASYAINLLTHAEDHCRFGMAAQEHARKKFDYRLIVPQYEKMYEDALNS